MQFIKRYEKVYSDEFCDKAIEFYNYCEKVGFVFERQSKENDIDKISKDDTSVYMPSAGFQLQYSLDDLWQVFHSTFWTKCYTNYADNFSILKRTAEHNIQNQSAKIQKTKPGQGYHEWHCEYASKMKSNRLMAWTVYLNDNFEAGETEFLYQQYRYKPQKGDCLIWPAGYTHVHRGNPPINGDKYILTGWIEF